MSFEQIYEEEFKNMRNEREEEKIEQVFRFSPQPRISPNTKNSPRLPQKGKKRLERGKTSFKNSSSGEEEVEQGRKSELPPPQNNMKKFDFNMEK